MDPVWAGIIAGVGSGSATAAIGGVVALRKVRSDLAAEYDKELRTERMTHYLEIWPQFAFFSTTKVSEITREQLVSFSDVLREWYFKRGGVYLSAAAMEAYNLLQVTIADTDDPPSERELAFVRFFAASLRTRMTEDLGTRRRPLVFRRSRLADYWRRRALYRSAERAVAEGGYAGRRLRP